MGNSMDPNAPSDVDVIVAQLMPGYLKNRELDLKLLKGFLEQKDWKAIENIAHRLKGSSAAYGLPLLGEMGSTLEESARLKDLQAVSDGILKIEAFVLIQIQKFRASSEPTK